MYVCMYVCVCMYHTFIYIFIDFKGFNTNKISTDRTKLGCYVSGDFK